MNRIFKRMSDHQQIELRPYSMSFFAKNPGIEIFVGSDSQNYSFKTIFATTVVFRYKNNGAHVIYHKEETPLVTDLWTRLWGELQRTIDVAGYLRFECSVPIEQIDLDINSDPNFASNKVWQAAVGYARAMGYNARTKPDILPATWAANVIVN